MIGAGTWYNGKNKALKVRANFQLKSYEDLQMYDFWQSLTSLSFSSWTGHLLLVHPDVLPTAPLHSLSQEADLQGQCHQMTLPTGFSLNSSMWTLAENWQEETRFSIHSPAPFLQSPSSQPCHLIERSQHLSRHHAPPISFQIPVPTPTSSPCPLSLSVGIEDCTTLCGFLTLRTFIKSLFIKSSLIYPAARVQSASC